ncbi:MAG TPA: diacylglycerol kinase family protein [Pirellulales bacterium]|nr:diacylglycerol kinase family protein [Pirellulales bacterium]
MSAATRPTSDLPLGVAIAANPYSGRKQNRRRVEALATALREAGLEPRLMWGRDELAAAAGDGNFANDYRAVVAAGGDGTLNRVINHPIAVPLAMFPLGNQNLFARQFGHNDDPAAMAAMIAAGKSTTIDLGRAAGRLFSIVASAGFDGDAAHRLAHWRERKEGRLKRVRSLSYARPIIASACRYRYPLMEVTADGRHMRGALVMVFNLPQYAADLPLAADAVADDSLLDWLVFEKPGSLRLAGYALSVWLKRHRRRRDVFHGRARRIELSCPVPVPLEIDGEAAGFAPLSIEVVPAALRVIVPE